MSRFWVLPVLGLIAVLAVGCSNDSEDVLTSSGTAISNGSPVPTVKPSLTTSSVPALSPSVPADWATFASADGLFTLRYPPTWFAEIRSTPAPSPATTSYSAGSLFSFDPKTAGPNFPPDAAKIDVEVTVPEGSSCRIAPSDATSATLGGAQGWEQSKVLESDGETRGVFVEAYFQGLCFQVAGYFGIKNTDESAFQQIVASFAFTRSP